MMWNEFIWNEDAIPEESRSQIRVVLMSDWDLIGVDGIPEAADEYDNYIPRIYRLLAHHATVGEVQDYLFEVVAERMGMSPPATLEHMQPAAESLKRLEFR